MTICPIARAVGCQKCAVVKICLLKSVLGDSPAPAPADTPVAAQTPRARRKKPAAK